MKNRLQAFLDIYGSMEIKREGPPDVEWAMSLKGYFAAANSDFACKMQKTPNGDILSYFKKTYKAITGKKDFHKRDYINAKLADWLVFKRTTGKSMRELESFMKSAERAGYAVQLLIDEPQFGASDRETAEGTADSLLTRIYKMLDYAFFDETKPHCCVGFSATPFDLHAIGEKLFNVRQKLSPLYKGMNWFMGERIDPDVEIENIGLASFSELAARRDFADMVDIRYLLGFTEKSKRGSKKSPYVYMNHDGKKASRLEMKESAYTMIQHLMGRTILKRTKEEGKPIGAIFRPAAGSNAGTDIMLREMGWLDEDCPYNVIRLYGGDKNYDDMERIIWEHTEAVGDTRPYIVVVSEKGRMGDTLPDSCEIGLDFTDSPTNDNAALQGLYGRLCGHKSGRQILIASDNMIKMIREYEMRQGMPKKGNNHTELSYTGSVQLREDSFLQIPREVMEKHPPLAAMIEYIDEYLSYLDKEVQGEKHIDTRRDGEVMFNLPEIMDAFGVGEYIRENWKDIDPAFVTEPRILDFDKTKEYKTATGERQVMAYRMSDDGRKCEVSVRNVDAAHGRGRTIIRAGRFDAIPALYVRKIGRDGNPCGRNQPGRYVFYALSFQLASPSLRTRNGEAYTPSDESKTRLNPSVRHSARVAMSINAQADHLIDVIARNLSYNSPEDKDRISIEAFEEAVAAKKAQICLEELYNPDTHHYGVTHDLSVVFYDKATGAVDNPVGPAEIYLDGRRSYSRQGVSIASLEDYEGEAMAADESPALAV